MEHFEVGDEVWYTGRGTSYNETTDRHDGVIGWIRYNRHGPGGSPRRNPSDPGDVAYVGSAGVELPLLHHSNPLVRVARSLD